eukprot:2490845-Rhodomonas_salina.1
MASHSTSVEVWALKLTLGRGGAGCLAARGAGGDKHHLDPHLLLHPLHRHLSSHAHCIPPPSHTFPSLPPLLPPHILFILFPFPAPSSFPLPTLYSLPTPSLLHSVPPLQVFFSSHLASTLPVLHSPCFSFPPSLPPSPSPRVLSVTRARPRLALSGTVAVALA